MSSAKVHLQQDKLRAIFNGMVDGIMVLDAEYRLQDWNAHFTDFVGLTPESVYAGMPIEDILRAQAVAGEFGDVDIEAEVARRTKIIKTTATLGTVERTRPNGRVLELRRSLMPGRGLVTLYTDITGRRVAEQQLRQAQKMEAVGQLTAGIAHDFNNLLMVVLGNLELGRTCVEAGQPVRAARHLEIAGNGANRAATLVGRLLSFARQQPLQPVAINVNQVLAGISDLLRHSIGNAIELETVLAGDLWTALVDPHQLENALLNLSINGRDAMEPNGKLTIETANVALDAAYAAQRDEVEPGQYVMIAVSDTGSGMTDHEKARAFEPFFTTKGVGKGSGLGLSQVFGFMKQSGGHVAIYSELDVGTTVKLYLPRAEDAAAVAIEHPAALPEPPGARDGECLLVVEDDADVLSYSIEALETLGYQVIGAPDGQVALEMIATRPDISLLLTDLELPGLNGRELAEEVRRLRPRLPVLFATGYPANAIIHGNLLGERVRCLNKPFTRAQLAEQVRDILDAAVTHAC